MVAPKNGPKNDPNYDPEHHAPADHRTDCLIVWRDWTTTRLTKVTFLEMTSEIRKRFPESQCCPKHKFCAADLGDVSGLHFHDYSPSADHRATVAVILYPRISLSDED